MDGFLLFAAIKCFGELGCFPVDGPFRCSQRPISVSPFAPDVINASFLLYTRRAPTSPQVFSLGGASNATLFGAWRQSKVIVHGFQEDGFSKEWIRSMVAGLLRSADFNVFVVDWAGGAHLPYHQAVANARVVGSIVARLIHLLQTSRNATAESFHLIGHSLGAHIAGYAGQRTPRLGRITGLDPAQPYFEDTDQIVRLDPSDASFVDVIHTDAKPFWRGGMGMHKQCGHLDFYPNGGKNQPGCKKNGMKAFFNEENNFVYGLRQLLTCNHKRAYTLFTESISSECPFISIPCRSHSAFRRGECFTCGQLGQDCNLMGFKADKTNEPTGKSIKYFLDTSSRAPHCQFQNRITVNLKKWSGHSGTLLLYILQNRTNKRIRIKLRVKTKSKPSMSAIFTSSAPIIWAKIVAKWRSDAHVRVNPFTYFNGNIPKMCIGRIVIDSINSDREISSLKFRASKDETCRGDEKQIFIVKGINT